MIAVNYIGAFAQTAAANRNQPEFINITVDEDGNVEGEGTGSPVSLGSRKVPPGGRLVVWGNDLVSCVGELQSMVAAGGPRVMVIPDTMEDRYAVFPPRPDGEGLLIACANFNFKGNRIYVGVLIDRAATGWRQTQAPAQELPALAPQQRQCTCA